jgi:hypothetical protein
MVQEKRIHSTVGGVYHDGGGAVNPKKKMEKVVKVWQAVMGTIAMIVSGAAWIFNLSTQIAVQQKEIEILKSNDRDRALQFTNLTQQINQKFDEINTSLTTIKVALQDKQNRK